MTHNIFIKKTIISIVKRLVCRIFIIILCSISFSKIRDLKISKSRIVMVTLFLFKMLLHLESTLVETVVTGNNKVASDTSTLKIKRLII